MINTSLYFFGMLFCFSKYSLLGFFILLYWFFCSHDLYIFKQEKGYKVGFYSVTKQDVQKFNKQKEDLEKDFDNNLFKDKTKD